MNNGLFLPNSHSGYQIATRPADIEEVREVTNVSGLVEGIAGITGQIHRILEGLKSANFIVSEIIEGQSTPRMVVYRSTELASRDKINDVEWLAKFQYDLWRQSLPIPAVMSFAGTQQVFAVFVGGKVWQRSEFIPGNNYRGTTGELASTAKAVAKLDLVLGQYREMPNFPKKVFGSLIWADWQECLAKITDVSVLGLVRQYEESLIHLLGSTSNDLARLVDSGSVFARTQLIHADIHPKNLICDADELKAIIDFGNMGYGSLGMDVANATHRLVRQFVVYQSEIMNQEEALRIGLQTFCSSFASAFQLPISVLKDLPIFMREILLRKIFDNLHIFSINREPVGTCLLEVKKFLMMLEEVDFMSSRFLQFDL